MSLDYDFSIRDDAEDLLEQVLDAMDEAIVLMRADLTIIYWNRGMRELCGLTSERSIGERIVDVFPDLNGAWFHELVNAADTFGRAPHFPRDLARRIVEGLGERAQRHADAVAAGRLTRVGRGLAYEGALALIVRIGRADASRPDTGQAGLAEAKDAFLANMSHQLRTPLNSLIGFVQLVAMGSQGALNDKQAALLAKAVQSGQRMARSIDTMVKITGIDLGRVTSQPVETSFAHVIEIARRETLEAAAEAGILLRAQVHFDEAIRIDEARLADALIEVLRNAIQFTEHGSTVTIDAERDPRTRQAAIRVRDHGPGMGAVDLEQAFVRYYTGAAAERAAHTGVGLGLSYAQACMHVIEGRIEIKSTPNDGCAVSLLFPLHLGASGAAGPPGAAA